MGLLSLTMGLCHVSASRSAQAYVCFNTARQEDSEASPGVDLAWVPGPSTWWLLTMLEIFTIEIFELVVASVRDSF